MSMSTAGTILLAVAILCSAAASDAVHAGRAFLSAVFAGLTGVAFVLVMLILVRLEGALT